MDHWLRRAAAMRPEDMAIETSDGSLSYAELDRRAREAAGALLAAGLTAGGRVALELESPLDFAVSLHGVLLAGGVAVPLDRRLSDAERAERATRAMLAMRVATVPEGAAIGGPPEGMDLDSVATRMFTSGTTSSPRPVDLTYGNWQANALGSAVALGLNHDERWLCPMPLVHVGGLSILLRSAIYATTAVVHGRFDTQPALSALMARERPITIVSLVPTMLARLLDAGLANPPGLRWALLGGAPIPRALLNRAEAAGVPVAATYGMTEACSQIATRGRPLPGVEVRVAADGELLVRGGVVAPGALRTDGWLHTGDLGTFDDRGRLVITGRKSDTIVTGGENVAPAEVEAVLLEHPAVADAGVHARPDAEWGEAIVATIVLHDGAAVDAGELREHCAARLARFKIPKEFRFAGALSRTSSGKLLRRELGANVTS